VGEVDEAQHAVHQRVPEGHEGVDGADGQAVDGLGPEVVDEAAQVEVDLGLPAIAQGGVLTDAPPSCAVAGVVEDLRGRRWPRAARTPRP
jgi:hypothetical protein